MVIGLEEELVFRKLDPATWPRVPDMVRTIVGKKSNRKATYLYASLMRLGQSLIAPFKCRMWMRSNESFVKVQSSSASSIWNCTFGGTLVGQRVIITSLEYQAIPAWLDWTKICSDDLSGWVCSVCVSYEAFCGVHFSLTRQRRLPRCRSQCRCRESSGGWSR